jgi:cyanate permease
MIEHMNLPIYSAVGSVAGLVAQITAPSLPDDFQTWPVTAMLAFLLLASLSVICWLSYLREKSTISGSKAVEETARAIQAMSDNQGTGTTAIKELAYDVRESAKATSELVAVMRARPCIK